MFCINCGKEVISRGKFCQHCGSDIPQQTAASVSTVDASPAQVTHQQSVMNAQATPEGKVNFLSRMQEFADAAMGFKSVSIIFGGIYAVFRTVINIVLLNTLGSITDAFGFSMGGGSVAGVVISAIISYVIGIAFVSWLFGFILKPLNNLEHSHRYFSELTYAKKSRFGLTFSGRVKFLYVWAILCIISAVIMGLLVIAGIITLISSGALSYLQGVSIWSSLIFPIFQLIMYIILIPVCTEIINAYKALRPAFGAIAMTDMYMFSRPDSTKNIENEEETFPCVDDYEGDFCYHCGAEVSQGQKACGKCKKPL